MTVRKTGLRILCLLGIISLLLAGTAAVPASGESTPVLEDFAHSRIGVITGSAQENVARSVLPEAEFVLFSQNSDMAIALTTGKIDAAFVAELQATIISRQDSSLTTLPDRFQEATVGWGFPKTEEGARLRQQVDEFFTRLKEDGTMEQILEKWQYGSEEEKTMPRVTFSGESGVLKVVTCGNMEPFEYIRNNTLVGSDIELTELFCAEYGYIPRYEDIPFASVLMSLAGGTCDLAATALVITDERRETIDFSISYYETCTMVLYKSKDTSAVSAGFFNRLTDSFERTFIREDRWRLIVSGLETTVVITLLSALAGTLLGFLLCVLRLKGGRAISRVVAIYVRLFQGTPMLVVLMLLYYVVFASSGVSAVFVAVLTFSLNFAAYVSENLRTGILAVDPGQREAALALGFSERKSFLKFVLPQAVSRCLPVYTGEMISLLKGTAVVGYIAVQDLTKAGDIIRSRTYEALFPLIAVALIYFALSSLAGFGLGKLQKAFTSGRTRRTVKGVRQHD